MAFDDRLQHILLGLAIGFVLGYLTRLAQNILDGVKDVKEELDEVDEIVKRINHDTNEDGFMTTRWGVNIAAILVVGLAFYASFVSQKASHETEAVTQRVETVSFCNLKVTTLALNALNERSTYSKQQVKANIRLQTDFSTFFNLILHQPPYSSEKQRKAAETYQKSLERFLIVSKKSKDKVVNNPFPIAEDLRKCIQDGNN